MLSETLAYADGWMILGETPGLGVALDEDRLAKTRLS
jgi:L-alanine-DL-glutamate epimerase-like enolase superfamily enzyme